MESRAESVPPMYPKIASALPHTSGGAAIPTDIVRVIKQNLCYLRITKSGSIS